MNPNYPVTFSDNGFGFCPCVLEQSHNGRTEVFFVHVSLTNLHFSLELLLDLQNVVKQLREGWNLQSLSSPKSMSRGHFLVRPNLLKRRTENQETQNWFRGFQKWAQDCFVKISLQRRTSTMRLCTPSVRVCCLLCYVDLFFELGKVQLGYGVRVVACEFQSRWRTDTNRPPQGSNLLLSDLHWDVSSWRLLSWCLPWTVQAKKTGSVVLLVWSAPNDGLETGNYGTLCSLSP